MQIKKITEILKEKEFTISAELVPPRNGTSFDEIYSKINFLKDKVDFISVTKGAGGSLRGGTTPITYFAQEKYGLNTIVHFVCRERTKQEIENGLTDMNHFNIKNILALRGDPPAGTADKEWDADYKYAYELVRQIKNMNLGKYVPTPLMKEKERAGEKSDFCILVAGHPEDPWEIEKEHIKCKIDAGAECIITQMIFRFKDYKEYSENLKNAGFNIPVIAGLRPLIHYDQAISAEKYFGVKVPEELMQGLKNLKEDKEKSREFGINYLAEEMKKLKEYGCQGVHLFILNEINILEDILKQL